MFSNVDVLGNYNVEHRRINIFYFNVVISNADVYNIVSMLIWRCPTSRHQINLTATLKLECLLEYSDCFDIAEFLLFYKRLLKVTPQCHFKFFIHNEFVNKECDQKIETLLDFPQHLVTRFKQANPKLALVKFVQLS